MSFSRFTTATRPAVLLALTAALTAALSGCATVPGAPTGEGSSAVEVEAVRATPPAAAAPAAASAESPRVAMGQAAGVTDAASAASSPASLGSATPPATTPDRSLLREAGPTADLWERLRSGFAIADYQHELVRKWENWYAADPAYVERMMTRGSRYLFHVLEEVDKRQMPTELALLPFIESAFNPQAESRARASGMWQFMPATGKEYELRQNVFRDDRRDVLASTRAALDYLQRLNRLFNDWPLALAAYNWGQGNVRRAMDRAQRSGRPAGYEHLPMPQETREYVPKLQAVKNIVMAPHRFGLTLPPLQNHPFFLQVPIERDIDAALVARLAGLRFEEFQHLNPQLNKPVILAAGTPQVLLPYDNANQFVKALEQHGGPLASWTAWVAPRTMGAADAAKLTGMDEAELRSLNNIPPRMLVKSGSTLLIARAPHLDADVEASIADNGTLVFTPEGRAVRRLAVKAGRQGSTVAAIAQQFGLAPSAVAQWNKTSAQGRFKPGQSIVVMLPAERAAPRVQAAVASKARGAATPASSRTAAPVKTARQTKPSPTVAGATKARAATKTAQPAPTKPAQKHAQAAQPKT